MRILLCTDGTPLAENAVRFGALIAQAGYPVDPTQVRQLPSICCGGCSG